MNGSVLEGVEDAATRFLGYIVGKTGRGCRRVTCCLDSCSEEPRSCRFGGVFSLAPPFPFTRCNLMPHATCNHPSVLL
jgi:hypothetical protein